MTPEYIRLRHKEGRQAEAGELMLKETVSKAVREQRTCVSAFAFCFWDKIL